MPTAPRPKKVAPPKPWQRAEAGRYRSSDDRFTLESEGSGRWFVTDVESLDELGLARTTGPFSTLDEAKAAADAARERAPEASPFAERIKEAASKPKRRPLSVVPDRAGAHHADATPSVDGGDEDLEPAAEPEPAREPEPPKRTWLDDLDDRDRALARTARRMIEALAREDFEDAESLVRRDILGNEPVVATRLLARDVLAAIASLKDPAPKAVAAAVADALAGSKRRSGLPGWRLLEQDNPTGESRGIRLTPDDLRDARPDA